MLLDIPAMKYFVRVISYPRPIHVDFLCDSREGAHLIRNLNEFGIYYSFLNIPVEKWGEWKKRPDYKGD